MEKAIASLLLPLPLLTLYLYMYSLVNFISIIRSLARTQIDLVIHIPNTYIHIRSSCACYQLSHTHLSIYQRKMVGEKDVFIKASTLSALIRFTQNPKENLSFGLVKRLKVPDKIRQRHCRQSNLLASGD